MGGADVAWQCRIADLSIDLTSILKPSRSESNAASGVVFDAVRSTDSVDVSCYPYFWAALG